MPRMPNLPQHQYIHLQSQNKSLTTDAISLTMLQKFIHFIPLSSPCPESSDEGHGCVWKSSNNYLLLIDRHPLSYSYFPLTGSCKKSQSFHLIYHPHLVITFNTLYFIKALSAAAARIIKRWVHVISKLHLLSQLIHIQYTEKIKVEYKKPYQSRKTWTIALLQIGPEPELILFN